jgi:predicted AlkP superfamily pyrophosphatase or phosphodiesterase
VLKRVAIICILFAALAAACRAHTPAAAIPRQGGPIVILISFDGWRWDYTDRANVPNMRALAARGVRSEGLIPSFPSKTYPNHYTIVTGLYPDHHGVISNNMWDQAIGERFTMSAPTAKDPRWWGGEPLWVTAVRQGLRASSMFWPGSEVEIGGVRPTDWRPYQDDLPNEARVKQVLDWLSLPDPARPSFITLYFSDVDTAGHAFGPEAPETMAAAAGLDAQLGALVAGIEARGLTNRTTIVAVADHGMSQQSPDRKILLDEYIDVETLNIIDWSPVLMAAPRQGSVEDVYRALRGKHPAFEVYKREDLPERLRFGMHPRVQPIIGIAADGWSITTRARFEPVKDERRQSGGEHGYEGRYRSMHGLFVAAGPDLRPGLTVPPVENIHLYELMCRILGLRPARNDGDPRETRRMLTESVSDSVKPSAAARTSALHSRR